MHQEFQWDPAKDDLNRRKHRVTFEEATTVFNDPQADIAPDLFHSADEERYRVIGYSQRNRLLTVIFTERHETIKIISARKVTGPEQAAYFEDLH
ncbi:MAG: BrnT family toxin [Phycisphaerales bacterium]|nr:BrnT family toxin [Phycisphaerales bacterium]